MKHFDLSGVWQCEIPGLCAPMTLPGTLDENHIGHPDTGSNQWHPDAGNNERLFEVGSPIATRLTRRFTYEGPAVITRRIHCPIPEGKRVFLECERARHLSLKVNGHWVSHALETSISTPHVFEITGLLTGNDTLTLISDNSYPDWPREDIVYSSAATDETQTNWNGILGYIRLRFEEPQFIQAVRVYPHGNTADVCVEASAQKDACEVISISSDALTEPSARSVHLTPGAQEIWFCGLQLLEALNRWDEEEGHLYSLTASLGACSRSVTFGIRDFGRRDHRFALNNRVIFLRSEANCAVFPESGYCPMTVTQWRSILLMYRSYGVNCMRFHSHCPPEAAFTAADELGMLMQPELSHWNPRSAFSSPDSQRYYRAELRQILRMLANHPSFVMLTLGNELHMTDEGYAFAAELLNLARNIDPTRLYASGSNVHYGQRGCDPASDFYTSGTWHTLDLRATNSNMQGWLNQCYPDLRTDYAPAVHAIHSSCDQPVFSFEVGQYEVLPDFDELTDYQGVTVPENIALIQRRVKSCGLFPIWKQQVEATGELSLLCYRAEVEAALRTEGLSGISLLGLQDFPGQGTALVGMLNPHLKPKPYPFAQPERFRAFFTSILPLALLERFTYTNEETFTSEIRMANYGKYDLCGTPSWALTGEDIHLHGTLPETTARSGDLTVLGTLSIPLDILSQPSKLTLTISLCGHQNAYDIWVYPNVQPVCPKHVHECRRLDDEALNILACGGTVYLAPDSTEEALPHSVQAQFSTDFWSVGTFPTQSGCMGQLIDASHPLFAYFPTQKHTDWQWWPMAGRRAMILPRPMQSIITEMDSYAYLRPMAQLLECRCHGGHLLISSLGLHDLQQYPEARALQQAIYSYLGSTPILPLQELTKDEVRAMVK